MPEDLFVYAPVPFTELRKEKGTGIFVVKTENLGRASSYMHARMGTNIDRDDPRRGEVSLRSGMVVDRETGNAEYCLIIAEIKKPYIPLKGGRPSPAKQTA